MDACLVFLNPSEAVRLFVFSEPCLNVQLKDVARRKFKNTRYTKHEGHSEWVRHGTWALSSNAINTHVSVLAVFFTLESFLRCSRLLESLGVFHQLCHDVEELDRDWLDGETWRKYWPTNEIVSIFDYVVHVINSPRMTSFPRFVSVATSND